MEMRIFYEFMLKRRFGQRPKKRGRKQQEDIILNQDQITFTYAEAERLGYSRATFNRAVDKLIEVGFLDLIYQGEGGYVLETGKIAGEASLYGLHDRWKHYGTDKFVEQKREKDTRKGRGWAAYHANRQQKEIGSNEPKPKKPKTHTKEDTKIQISKIDKWEDL
jgi:hypothetical protein